jgi:hypothetical protein
MAGCVTWGGLSTATATRCDCNRCDRCHTCRDSYYCPSAETCSSACSGSSCTGRSPGRSLGFSSGSCCTAGRLLRLLRACINGDKDQSEYHKQNGHLRSHSFLHGVPRYLKIKEEDRIQKSEDSSQNNVKNSSPKIKAKERR